MATHRVLVFEPDCSLRGELEKGLQGLGWVVACGSREEAEAQLERQHFHLVLWRVGAECPQSDLPKWCASRPDCAVVAVADCSEPSQVVACMRAGAANFWDQRAGMDRLQVILRETLERTVFTQGREPTLPVPDFIGRHPKILEVFELIESIRGTDSTVLITGESGTGKEVVARAIHELSPRRKSPLVAVNCGAIPGALLESELFGHVKGAFTGATQNRMGRFQLAGSGTLFLDEIGDLPIDLQAKLLRALQSRTFEAVGSPHSLHLEARVIAATNQDLEEAVAERRFREDLFYRLNVIPIFLPPLRSRKSDVPLLVKHFLDKFARTNEREIDGISEPAMRALMDYHWPGNVRELENLIERVVVLKRDGGLIELKDIPTRHFRNVRVDRFVANVELPETGIDFNEAVNEFENELIIQALHRTDGNRNQAATLLNLNRTTLVEKLKRKGLRVVS